MVASPIPRRSNCYAHDEPRLALPASNASGKTRVAMRVIMLVLPFLRWFICEEYDSRT